MAGSAMAMVLLPLLLLMVAVGSPAESGGGGTIGFSTLGRLSFEFDVYTLALPPNVTNGGLRDNPEETRVTLGESVSYNAQLVEAPWGSAIVQKFLQHGDHHLQNVGGMAELLLYVSEVEGSPQLYLDIPIPANGLGRRRRRPVAVRDSVVGNGNVAAPPKAYLNDKPSMHGNRIIFVSTEEPVGVRVQGWNAVFSLDFATSVTKRLTPPGVTDYSPAVSPSGEWVAAASNEGRGWLRETEALNIDLYIFKAEDGSERKMVVRNAGWPAWADESTVYFHRLAEDGWWSIFKINVFSNQEAPERVTPSGVHAFTPAVSRCKKWIAVATRRTSFRHIEIFDLQTKTFIPVTQNIHPNTNHYNPFISPSSNKLGYHRCRGSDEDAIDTVTFRMEYQQSPIPGVSLYRIDGSFPVMSPDGSKVAFVDSGNASAPLALMNLDGSQKRFVYPSSVFGTNWDSTRKDTVYASQGGVFKGMKVPVHIVAVQNVLDSNRSECKFLTKKGTGNNAFPSVSPDGKYVVFRSGRSGHKNLYVMDAEGGEEKYLRRLTDGPWRDTMPAWSPDNEWIAFSSNRLYPNPKGEKSFSLYLIRPNGTDLHMLLDTGIGGLAMHPQWSPDGKRIVFASNYAGVSAEPIAYPHAYQPYGTIFVINVDGTGLTRMTHNAYEDGTPSWGRLSLSKAAVSSEGDPTACSFEDVWFLNSPASIARPPGPGPRLCQRSWRPAHVTDSLLLQTV